MTSVYTCAIWIACDLLTVFFCCFRGGPPCSWRTLSAIMLILVQSKPSGLPKATAVRVVNDI